MPEHGEPLTTLLQRMTAGDRQAADRAVALVYDELHRIAANRMRGERPGHTLQTTALVNEAYMRLMGSDALNIQNRGHFFALASQQMRRILVDHARSSLAKRRGGGAAEVELDRVELASGGKSVDILALDEALEELAQLEPRAAKVVELRYFGGYTDQEVVQAMDLSLATVRRDWEFARAWLFQRMKGSK